MNKTSDPDACAVCGAREWRVAYAGPIRHGTFGNTIDATVFRCEACGVGFLPTSVGLIPDFYAGDEYRETVGEGTDAENFFRLHDVEQLDRFPLMRRTSIRHRVVAEVGCAAGSFLD